MMKKSSGRFANLLFWISILIIVSLACNLPTTDLGNLSLDPRADDGSISGTYSASGDPKVNFSVTTDGLATFHIDGAPDSHTLTVNLSDEHTSRMDWKGTTLDGLGPLTTAEQSALDDLMMDEIAHGLTMIPIDIGCQGDDALDPQQAAALLVPLQLRYKYLVTDRWAESQKLIALSQCDYEGSGKGDPASFITLSRAAPVPVVFGYFPFDAEGAVEAPLSSDKGLETACLAASPSLTADGTIPFKILGSLADTISGVRTNEYGPCAAMCRGACGADCEPRNCRQSKELRCEKDENGNNTGLAVQYLIYDCGLHQGCIDHDNCYDQCNQQYGCNTWLATDCRHGIGSTGAYKDMNYLCDRKAIDEYGPIATNDWRRGWGAKQFRETYEYLDFNYVEQQDLEKCPIDESAAPPLDNQDDSIPVGTYVGTSNYPQILANSFDPGQYTKNEVTVHVAEDGTVSGSYSVYYIGNQFTTIWNDEECTGYGEADFSGMFFGQLTSSTGIIKSEENWICTIHSDCDLWDLCSTDEPFYREFDIQVSGDQMTGTTLPHPEDTELNLIWTFNAKR